jgi:hypothetical protein
MESTQKETTKKKRTLLSKLLRIFAWIIGSVIFLVILILLLIQLPSVQNFGRKKVVAFLESKLKTKVEIGKLDIKFPTDVSLQNVFFEDQSKDTLLFGKELRVNLKMFELLKSNVEIEEIYLDGIIGKVKKIPPDSVFNFQFIVDAFASQNKKQPVVQDSSTLKIDIARIVVKNSRIIYDDPYSGNDMKMSIGLLDGKIEKFDPEHLFFNIPSLTLNGIKGYYHQLEPLKKSVEKVVAEAASQEDNFLQLLNKSIKLSDIDIVFKSEPSKLYSSFKIGDMIIHPETLDLKNSIITLRDAKLDHSAITVQTQSAAPKEMAKDTVIVEKTPSFKIIAGKLAINKSSIKYDDASAPRAPSGMDYSHLNLKDFSFNATGIRYNSDTIIANIHSGSLNDTSGFVLNKLETNFQMNPTGVSLEDLYLETPGTILKRSAIISYPSMKAMQKNPGVLGLDINLAGSKISVKDINTFIPSLAGKLPANATLYADARITGRVDNLNLQKVILRGLNGTDINVNGIIKGLPQTDKMFADLKINKFQTSRKDILALVPKNTIPSNITLPQNMNASGIFRGSMTSLYTDLTINTSLGGAKITGSLGNITDKRRATYNMNLKARNLRVGTLIKNPELGSLTADVKVKGKGYDPETADALFDAVVSEVTLKGYNYKDVVAKGNISNKNYAITASVQDPNIDINIDAQGQFTGKYPGLKLKATIDSIKTLPLHLTTTKMLYHGVINGDFKTIDPDHLDGKLFVTHSVFVNEDKRITLDSLSLIAKNQADTQSLALYADFLNAKINGKYTLTQLGDVFQQIIDPYFAISNHKNVAKVDPYSFSLNASIVENPNLIALAPELKRLDPVTMTGNFASDSGWNMNIRSPFVQYGTNIINDLNINAGTGNDALLFKLGLKEYQNGPSMVIHATALNGTIKDNKIDFKLNIKDAKAKDLYVLGGKLSQASPDNYTFSLNADSLLLNYEKWTAGADNFIQYKNKDIIAHNFVLSQGTQQLSINSTSQQSNSPLKVDFKNFKISTLTSFVQTDTLIANGLLNGGAIVKNIQTQPTFTADLNVKDLTVYGDTLGTLTAKVDNNIANTYNAAIALEGFGNKINIDGKYNVKPKNSSYDFLVNIPQFNMKSLEGLSNGAIKDARGFIFGKIALNGSLDNPNIDGKLSFENTSVNISMLNNVFKIDKEAIAIINNKGIELDKFSIRDTANNALTIDGAVNTTNFRDYVFNLGIRANNFQAINSTNKDNDLFYGKMVFSTRMTVKGTPTHPIVDGDLTINDATDFTIVLPQDEPGVVERKGVVRFVDYSATKEDSVFMRGTAGYDSLNTSSLVGYDVTMNLNIVKEATFNVIVDQGNGDFLRLKGTGQLTGGIDASGKITLTGSYQIEEGGYNLTFNFIKRKFDIQKGSSIVWTGEPTTAKIDITAVYIANTAPLDLVQSTAVTDATYKQKLPFNVNLQLNGEIMKPQISFDIVLPKDRNYNVSNVVVSTVQNRLIQLRQEPAEMNKQVFALLLLNRFVGENPFDNSAGGSLDAATFAKQSVSKLLSEQLNSLAEGLIQGVDINFDLATTEDYTTGTKQDRTDLNVGVSKRLLDDRLTVSVGTNFELEGPRQTNQSQNNLAGNININYKLSKDGRYALRAYRKNDYTGTVEGYVVETGIAFVISIDYNQFKQIFISAKQRNKAREIRRKNSEIKKQDTERKEEEKMITTPTKARENEQEND